MLRKGRAEHDKNTKEQLMMEAVDTEILNSTPSPRTFNTHLPFSMLPVPEMKARRLKLVHVYRNPKDICVSLYHMTKSSMMMQVSSGGAADSFASFFEHFFFSDKVMLGPYFRYMRQMHEFQQQHPQIPFINMAYEDVKKDPVDSVKQLASFLRLPVSNDLCDQIAEECSFDRMKKMAAEKARVQFNAEGNSEEMIELMKTQMPVIYRKGHIGDWKNYFTVAMNERADAVIEQEMEDLPFTLTFE
ncbi:hypothetical protein V1264_022332 [Littorina saxatilis]|uniref:Sulfotransferase domain-containing protein n=2 Tax=Littorina saxatilis TaxID=31220 RepID=A0AAN9AK22_9CAEN